MANTFTNIAQTMVQKEIVEALKIGLAPLNVFSLSVGSEPANKNQFVNVPLITLGTATSDVTSNVQNYESGDTTVVGKQVNLNTTIFSSWHITANQASVQDIDFFAKTAKQKAYEVAYAARLAALNLIIRGSYGTGTEKVLASTDCDSDSLFDIRNTVMNTLKWSQQQGAALVLDGAYYANLGKDPAVKDLSASGDSTAKTGLVAKHAGFDIYEDGQIAASTPYGANNYLRGFACLPQAMALAIRPPAQVGNGAVYDVNEIITDPDTGISCNYRSWISPVSNTLWGTIEVLFGGVAVDGNALYRIVSQTSS